MNPEAGHLQKAILQDRACSMCSGGAGDCSSRQAQKQAAHARRVLLCSVLVEAWLHVRSLADSAVSMPTELLRLSPPWPSRRLLGSSARGVRFFWETIIPLTWGASKPRCS